MHFPDDLSEHLSATSRKSSTPTHSQQQPTRRKRACHEGQPWQVGFLLQISHHDADGKPAGTSGQQKACRWSGQPPGNALAAALDEADEHYDAAAPLPADIVPAHMKELRTPAGSMTLSSTVLWACWAWVATMQPVYLWSTHHLHSFCVETAWSGLVGVVSKTLNAIVAVIACYSLPMSTATTGFCLRHTLTQCKSMCWTLLVSFGPRTQCRVHLRAYLAGVAGSQAQE
jgi:hypothetical protein